MKNIKMLIVFTIIGVATKIVCGVDPSTVRMRSVTNYRFPPEPPGPRPLMLPSNGKFALLGYVFGQAYPQEEKSSRAIRGDVVEKFTPTYPMSEAFHGINTISCELTPITQRLYSLRLERGNFSGREQAAWLQACAIQVCRPRQC